MKTKSKSLISIILSIMMVLSMVIVAVPVNAATVEDTSTGDTTYYLWYSFGKTNIGGTGSDKWSKITMTSAGTSTYTATLDVSTGYNMYFSVNTNANYANSTSSTWSSTSDVQNNVTFTSDVKKSGFYPQAYGANSSSGTYVNYYYPRFSLSSAQKLTFTFTPSKKVVVSTAITTTTYTVSKASTSHGSFTVNKSSNVAENESITITPDPDEGYEVDTVTVTDASGNEVGTTASGSNYTFTMPASNVTVSVTFKLKNYSVIKVEQNGTFEVSATSATMGTTVTISNITPASGYEFDSITASGGATLTPVTEGSEYTFTMPASNVTVTVTFEAIDTPTVDWYIGGINLYNGVYNPINAANTTYKMTSEGNNVYTYTYTFKEGNNTLYVVMNDGTTAYHPEINSTDPNGTYPGTTENQEFTKEPSWQATYPAGTKVKYTWNATTMKLTWEEIVEVSSKWSLVGDFNDWNVQENPMSGSGTYTTSLYLPANSTGFEFKIKNNQAAASEYAYYSKVGTTINDSNLGTAYTLDNGESISTEANINLITTGGVYTFTWVEDTNKLTVTKGSTYTLTATGTIPETIGAGEELNMTINASYTGNPVISYYKYTVKAGAKSVASGVQNTSSTYNCKTTLSTNSTITYFVKAYNANDELIGLTATGSKEVTVTVGDFKVDLRVDKTEVIEEETFTLTATVDPADYAGTYKFFQSTDGQTYTQLGSATSSNTKTVSLATKGKYYFKVEVTNFYDSSSTVESYRIEVDVYDSDSASESHEVKIYFKSASSFIYKPTLTLDGTVHEMSNKFETVKDTEGNVIIQPFIGNAYSGSLKFYWFKVTITFDSTKDNTITFKTGRTQVNASFTSRFLADEYYFAVDNLMSDRTVYNLTTANEAIRNFYHSPLNMVTMGDTSDGNLGFTNVNGQTVKMGSILTATVDVTGATVIQASFSIRSATVAQKIAAEIEEVSDTQYSLLDVNLDGNVDVRDATLMQKALVNA